MGRKSRRIRARDIITHPQHANHQICNYKNIDPITGKWIRTHPWKQRKIDPESIFGIHGQTPVDAFNAWTSSCKSLGSRYINLGNLIICQQNEYRLEMGRNKINISRRRTPGPCDFAMVKTHNTTPKERRIVLVFGPIVWEISRYYATTSSRRAIRFSR